MNTLGGVEAFSSSDSLEKFQWSPSRFRRRVYYLSSQKNILKKYSPTFSQFLKEKDYQFIELDCFDNWVFESLEAIDVVWYADGAFAKPPVGMTNYFSFEVLTESQTLLKRESSLEVDFLQEGVEKEGDPSFIRFIELFEVGRMSTIYSQFWKLSQKRLAKVWGQADSVFSEMMKDFEKGKLKENLIFFKWWEKIEGIRERSSMCSNLEDLVDLVAEFLKTENLIHEFRVLEKLDLNLLETISSDPKNLLMPVKDTDETYVFIKIKRFLVDDEKSISFVIANLANLFEQFFLQSRALFEISSSAELLDRAFSSLEIPLVLLNSNMEIVLHNNGFLQLGLSPKKCSLLENGERLELNEEVYGVTKEEINPNGESLSYYAFLPLKLLEQMNSNVSSKTNELGIISSSVAHELNNPIGGLLAGVEYLKLLEDWDEDALESLDEMKTGALRCKKLVEIFLGFSKANLKGQKNTGIREAFYQGLDLIRFRIIESGVRFHWELSEDPEDESFLVNIHLFSMFFYLIFGELITAYSHMNLVTMNPQKRDGVINGRISFKKSKFCLELSEKYDLSSLLSRNKLIKHLLDLEQCRVNINSHSIEVEPK